jgi:REP element-mobilizing transposase RayT
MVRHHPPNIPGATYHVMNRGNRKARIFEDDRDRKRFVRLLVEAKTRYDVEILNGSQMGNHFHALVTTPRGNLPEFMRQFQGDYARYSNWRHGRVGHLFQGRYRRVFIENDLHLFIAAAYIFDNPVDAGLVSKPEDWKWSTYAATIGLAPIPSYLSLSWVQMLFPTESLTESQKLLRQCLDDPQRVLSYLSCVDPTSEDAIRSYIAERRRIIAQPCPYQKLIRPTLEQLCANVEDGPSRAEAILQAHQRHGYTLAEIARHLGVRPTTISKAYRAALRS